ncbi:MAG: ABC transporter ATP-binding protein [Planctomycetes bacterium]|nr:ABC transporter ATP-binding protein [Planctomycetota bacterium]
MSALEIREATKRFGDVAAVDGVSLEVEPGAFCVLLGPSGCGKSTLLRLIAGLETPTGGRIAIGGRDVTGLEPKERDIAMVFQIYAHYPHLSVFDNMAFPLRVRRIGEPEVRQRVEEAAELLQLSELLKRRPRELSGGQRQRVAIGRAIVRRPKLFLFDEPLSNLDAKLRHQMRAELARLHRHLNATSIYVTHDQVEAMTLSTRIALMNAGRFEQVGSPQEMYDRPATRFAAAFVGSPAMNLIEGRVEGRTFEGAGLRLDVEVQTSGAATLGVRPEDLELVEQGPWSGKVDLVEYLGAETLIHVRCGDLVLVVRTPQASDVEQGRNISFRPRRVHLFDPSGRRIG